MQGRDIVFGEDRYTLIQCPIYGIVSPMVRFHKSKNQGLEIKVVPLTITTSDSLAKCLPPIPESLCSANLKVLVPKQGMLSPGDTLIISLKWKLRLPRGHLGFLMSELTGKEGSCCIGWDD